MQDKIRSFVEKIGSAKIEFSPTIKIKKSPHSWPLLIKSIAKADDSLIVSFSGGIEKELSACTTDELSSLSIRLYSMIEK